MSGVNKALILGRLGKDPELKYTQSGTPYVRLSVATSEQWTDKQSGQRQEKTEWHNVTVWGRPAENCQQYLVKGSQVYVEGKIQTTQYQKDGQTRYATGITAQSVQFLGSPQGGGSPAPGYVPSQNPQGYQQQAGYPPKDDIPF